LRSAIHFLTAQDARVRGNTHYNDPMEPRIYGQLAKAMTTTVSRRPNTPNEEDGENKPMWSLEPASLWARLDAACTFHALAESDPLITTVLAMLPPKRPTVAPLSLASRSLVLMHKGTICRLSTKCYANFYLSVISGTLFPC
jgi:hypothetical protein